MNKKTKLILGGLTLVGLIIAYKKGVFGGKSSSGPSQAVADQNNVELPSDAVTITPTGDPQGIIVMPNNFANMAPITESYA